MPRIEKYFAGQAVPNWTSGTLGGGGGGGNIISGGDTYFYTDSGTDYLSHTFTASGNFQVHSGAVDVDVMIVAGGGAAAALGGGGGAGGHRTMTAHPVSATGGPASNGVYPIVVGAGGTQHGSPSTVNGKGSDSSAFGTTSTGGGGGGTYGYWDSDPAGAPTYCAAGQDGGSGGGAGGDPSGTRGYGMANPTTSPVQGYIGGTATMSMYGGGQGGGGGAGGAGGNGFNHWTPTPRVGGVGGTGAANVYRYGPGTPVTYAGGGGGGGNGNGAPGGAGGGGDADNQQPAATSTATVSTGGGGGGIPTMGPYSTPRTEGFGGSGIVVLRYPIS